MGTETTRKLIHMRNAKNYIKGSLIWAICAIFFLYEFFLRTVIGAYQTPIMDDLHLSLFEFSILSSTAFLMIYGIMQIPVGIIIDNFGLKKSLLFACILCSLSTMSISYSYDFTLAIFSRIIMAIGASFGFICLLIAVNDWLPGKYRGIFIGLSQFIGTLGPMFAAGPLEKISQNESGNWRNLFMILSFIGIILSILIFFIVENRKKQANMSMILTRPERTSILLKRLFKNPQPWFIALLAASIYFSIEYLSENEGRNFLAQKQIDIDKASYLLTLSWLGYAIGAPILGLISDLIERRKIILIFGSFMGFVGIYIIVYSAGMTYLILGFLLLGIGASSQSICFALMAEQFKEKFIAVGFGLNNAIITFVASVNAPMLGFFLDRNKVGDIITIENYTSVFRILIAMSIIAIILSSILIKETYCKSAVSPTILSTS